MSKNNSNLEDSEIDGLYRIVERDAHEGGYLLNPDDSFTRELIRGLVVNTKRYGYAACPCRLASGDEAEDRDMVCPCDYRDADLNEYGACYCALYVTEEVASGKRKLRPLPDRRERELEKKKKDKGESEKNISGLSYPVWRCSVCGYLAARSMPPEKCPICKVSKERFEKFI
ncbi:MAG TPA: ferredoxin-thioredoxin reductase catalytic domain-containing protein [Spirochaetota bacterium]|mgnify:CR=1 FL=1|nr:ferredoxin-thioredoxin reductase catalytic domain-containing protein [Spirochaetota bacterium]